MESLLLITIGLSIFTIVLLTKYRLLKKEIQNINKLIDNNNKLNISLVDKDFSELTKNINNLIETHNEMNYLYLENEANLKEIIVAISHDLRTPLTSMVGYMQLIEQENISFLEKENLEIVGKKINELKILIDEFFELSSIDLYDKNLEMSKVNLQEVFTETIISYVKIFEGKNIIPDFNVLNKPIYINTNKKILDRIFHNLISNTLKNANSRTTISFIETENDTIKLSIENDVIDGFCIDTAKVFDKFYTNDLSRTRSDRGIGLYIVKSLSELLDIDVCASFHGNLFKITLTFQVINT